MGLDRVSLHDCQFSDDFGDELVRILTFLQEQFDFDLWSLTRFEEDNWVVVKSVDRSYGISEGDAIACPDSFSSRMVEGSGSQISPDSDTEPCYRLAPLRERIPIRAYMGCPVTLGDGQLFGTLCAIHPEPRSQSICDGLRLLQMFGSIVGRMIEKENQARDIERFALEAKLSTEIDPLTGLKNRMAWKQSLHIEEERASALASPTSIIILDLDDLKATNDVKGQEFGDLLIKNFTQILTATVGDLGKVFRLGGNEFGVLLPNTHMSTTRQLLVQVRNVLGRANISSSIGVALRDPKKNLQAAWEQADREMQRDKERVRPKRAA